MEGTSIEQRLLQVEYLIGQLTQALASVKTLATQAAQNAQLSGGPGAGAGSSGGAKLAWFPTGMTALSGNTLGYGPFQYVMEQVNPTTEAAVLVSTGDAADSGQLAYNLSSGGSGSATGSYGLVFPIGGLYYGIADCNNDATAPPLPAGTVLGTTTTSGGVTTITGTLMTSDGRVLVTS